MASLPTDTDTPGRPVIPVTADVVIAGAGPAGSIAARHLARAGCRVLMVDGLRPGCPRLGETLPGAAIRLLSRQGLGSLATAGGAHAPVAGSLVVWGADQPVATDAIRDPYGPGLRLDRTRFDTDLRQASIEAGTTFVQADVRHLERCNDHWIVHLNGSLQVSTGCLIDATGRSGRLLRLLHQPRHKGAPLVALYQAARPTTGQNLERTLIEARPDGWFYAGKLGDNRWVVGFHTCPEDAARLSTDATALDRVLTHAAHISGCLGDVAWEGPLLRRDARSMAAVSPYGPGWFAIGDAALAFDPIAGQGLFNALRTGLAAANAILDGSSAANNRYAEEIQHVARIYFERRKALYEAEERWSSTPFWRGQLGSPSSRSRPSSPVRDLRL